MNATNESPQKISHQQLPGATPLSSSLIKEFNAKYNRLGSVYQPRTRHKNAQGAALFTNRLFLESSPYLAQHAHNPVNWFSWGDEAFQQAKDLQRPVLVSIGYSTCHWCHVMEEESFEDLEIAEFLNQHYICIKVDREERPDLDAIYMTAVQTMTGSGGWPLNVAVTHERKPFWGGTYFPPRNGDRGTAYGFLSIIEQISQVYTNSPQEIKRSCEQLTGAIESYLSPPAGKNMPDVKILDDSVEMYKKAYDPENGGVKGAPKFPSSLPTRLLLRYYQRTGQSDVLEMVTNSLRKMAAGGMYDQVGGGFHRYSTDAEWLVPHFEKMLYDNALLAVAYVEAYQVSGDELFREITMEILDYVLREMTSESGAFFSATDADSLNGSGEREEGFYFSWTADELQDLLSNEQYRLVEKVWGVSEHGNFEGRNIFHLKQGLAEQALKVNVSMAELKNQLSQIKQILYQERNKRHLPLRDDKIIVSWNGLMISAFAIAGDILGEPRFVDAAVKAAEFIEKSMVVDGRLYRTWKDGNLKVEAFLSDYANFIGACLDLFRATQDLRWFNLAQVNDQYLKNHFEDKDNGGFYMAGSDQEILITHEKPVSDGALPSGNSITIQNLFRFYTLTLENDYKIRFEKAISCFLGKETGGLAGYSEMLAAFELSIIKPIEIVIVFSTDLVETTPYLNAIKRHFLHQAQVFAICGQNPDKELLAKIPYLRGRRLVDGKTTVYLCQEGSCNLPVTDLESFVKQLSKFN